MVVIWNNFIFCRKACYCRNRLFIVSCTSIILVERKKLLWVFNFSICKIEYSIFPLTTHCDSQGADKMYFLAKVPLKRRFSPEKSATCLE